MQEWMSLLLGVTVGVLGTLFGVYQAFPQRSECSQRHGHLTEAIEQLIEEHDNDVKELRRCLLELKTELQAYMRAVSTVVTMLADSCQDPETRRIVMEQLRR